MSPEPNPTPTDPMLTPREVAELLGVDRQTVKRYVAAGLITAYRYNNGKTTRIPRSSVQAYMQASRVTPTV